jgi:dihydrofolate reductase
MGVTQFFTAMSLDGYLADEQGSLDWLFNSPHGEGGEDRWGNFFSRVGAMAMGATTYRWALDHDALLDNPQRWHDYYEDRPCWVFSHGELPAIPDADIRFVSGDVAQVHAQMKAVSGDRNIWVVGGGDLVGQFHDAGLLDELLHSIAPVILGAGTPLLPRLIEGMSVLSAAQDGSRVDIRYAVRGGSDSPETA